MDGEKAWRQLHKKSVSNIEQVLETAPHKAAAVWPPTTPITKTIKIRWTRHVGHCWRSRDKLISDVLLWTPSHGHAKAGQPVRTYIQQLCGERGSGISMLIAWHDDDDDEPLLFNAKFCLYIKYDL